MRERFCPQVKRSTSRIGAEEGVSLVEVIAAMGILALVLLPMLDFAAYTYTGQAYEKQLAATLAASKLEELQSVSYRSLSWPWPGGEEVWVGGMQFIRTWSVVQPSWNPERNYLREVTLQVWCENCRNQDPITVVTYIAKVGSEAESSKLEDPAE